MTDNKQNNRVLVVDDEPTVTIFLAECLEKLGCGYIVETANSGGEALVKIRQSKYALVLTDYKMPGINGLEVARAVRHFSPHTRVVLMTAYGTEELLDRVRHSKLDGYIEKPFTVDQILEIVKRAVEQAEGENNHLNAHSLKPSVHEHIKASPAEASAESVESSAHKPLEALPAENDARSMESLVDKPLNTLVSEASARSTKHPVHKPSKMALAKMDAHSPGYAIHKLLEALLIDTSARCVLLISSSGYPVATVGQTYGLPIPSLGALIAANFTAEAELARLLGNSAVFKASHHEGPEYNIYSCDVNGDLLLVVIFSSESKAGAVWFFTKRTAVELASLLIDKPSEHRLDGDFAAAIDEQLGQLFASENLTLPQ